MSTESPNYFPTFSLVALLVIGLFGCASTTTTSDSDSSDAPPSQQASDSESEDSSDASEDSGEEQVELRLTRDDHDQLYGDLIEQLEASELFADWQERNDAGEEISVGTAGMGADGYTGLAATAETLANRFETYLVNQAPVSVIPLREREALRQELELSREVSDPGSLPEALPDTEPDYLMTGTISGQPETIDGTRQAQYEARLQFFSTDTGGLVFEAQAHLRKP